MTEPTPWPTRPSIVGELPAAVVDEAARLTRLARSGVDDEEAAVHRQRREEVLAENGYVARVRIDNGEPVLICHPEEWLVDGAVRPHRIDDIDRAVERPLYGTGEDDEWAAVDAHNRAIVEAVAEKHGSVHARTVGAFADFMGNHYARRLETAGDRECREFLQDYFPRNAWPTDDQRAVAAESVRLAFAVADAEPPAWLRDRAGPA